MKKITNLLLILYLFIGVTIVNSRQESDIKCKLDNINNSSQLLLNDKSEIYLDSIHHTLSSIKVSILKLNEESNKSLYGINTIQMNHKKLSELTEKIVYDKFSLLISDNINNGE